MKHVLHIARLTARQGADRAWCWFPPGIMLVTLALSVSNRITSLQDFYRTPTVILVFTMFPVIFCAGILWEEVATGRVLILHSLGVSRPAFVLGRTLGAAAFCVAGVAVPHFAVCIYLSTASPDFSWRAGGQVLCFVFFYFVYCASVLVFVSTFVRSWGNSALVMGLQLVAGALLDLFSFRLGEFGPSVIRFGRLLIMGPLGFVMQSSRSASPDAADLIFVTLLTAAFLLAASSVYGRTEIGKWAGRA